MQFSKGKLGATVGILGMGGVALGLLGTGVGANFVQSLTGNATISVGHLGCEILPSSGVTVNGDSATVSLPQINSSAPSSSTLPVTVADNGTTNTYINWVVSTSGHIFDTGVFSPVMQSENAVLSPNTSHTYNLGFQWGELSNADENQSGTVTYTVNCTDNPFPSALSPMGQDGGTAAWNPTGGLNLTIPANPAPDAAAIIDVTGQSSALPSTEPTFTTNNYAAGSPRWYIQLTNGKFLFGYPTNAGLTPGSWSENNGNSYVPWSKVLTDEAGQSVTGVSIIMDGDQPATTNTISHIQYDGVNLLG
jgi:hypothetical protein